MRTQYTHAAGWPAIVHSWSANLKVAIAVAENNSMRIPHADT